MPDLEKGVQSPMASAVGTAYATSGGSLDPPPASLQATTAATPPGKFYSGLLDCCSDPCTACSAWCCSFVAGPQLYERVTGERGSCQKWFVILVLVWFIAFICRCIPVFASQLTASIFDMIYWVIGTMLLCTVRQKVRRADRIGNVLCYHTDDVDDFACSYFCFCCTIAQMFNHLGVKSATGYTLTSPTGSDSVPRNYPPYGVAPEQLGTVALNVPSSGYSANAYDPRGQGSVPP